MAMRSESAGTAQVLAGKYTLLRRLGQGGMAEVFLARQGGLEGFEKLVVLKRILPALAADPEFVDMFLEEARLAADLRHPHVVTVLEAGEDRGTYFLAMEFLHGQHVGALIRRCLEMAEPLPLDVAVRIIMDAAQGLQHAHAKKDLRGQPLQIVHRDVSPQNIMVTVDGVSKILDFGIAKAASRRADTQAGVVKGKLAYMAPEQALGSPVDARADQWALAVVAWEMTTLSRLFPGATPAETLALVTRGAVRLPSSVVPGYPAPLERVLLRALSPDRAARFADCRAFAQALEAAAEEAGLRPTHERVAAAMEHLFRESLDTGQLLAAGGAQPGGADRARTVAARGRAAPVETDGTHLLEAMTDFLNQARREPFQATPVPERRTNLAAVHEALIGRDAEVAELRAALETARVVTLVGPPGVGRSRLAATVARECAASAGWTGGAWRLDASGQREVDALARAMAAALEVGPVQGRGAAEVAGSLRALLGARGRLLLLLDDVEVTPEVTELLGGVTAGEGITLLLTALEPTGLAGERVLEVRPLGEADSVALLRARAGNGPEGSDPLQWAELAGRLDGLPLALEWAAARLRERPLDAVIAELADPTGTAGQGLGGAFSALFARLGAEERDTLVDLSVFEHGFTLDAAEHVLGGGPPRTAPVADTVRALRRRHLIRTYVPPEFPTELRWALYDSVQPLLRERLAASGSAAEVEDRHNRYFLRAGGVWVAGLSRTGGAERLRRLFLEYANLQATWRRALLSPPATPGRLTTLAHAALVLDPVFAARGPTRTHLEMLAAVAEGARAALLQDALQAQLLEALGNARKNQGDLAAAVADLREAEQAAVRSHDRALVARVRCNLGVALFVSGRLAEAATRYEQALTIARDVLDEVTEGRAQCFLGILHIVQGRAAEARASYAAALELARRTGDRLFEGRVLGNLGAVELEEGRPGHARAFFEQSIAILGDMKDRRLMGYYRGKLAGTFHLEGDLTTAASGYREALGWLSAVGDRRHGGLFRACLASALAGCGKTAEARSEAQTALETLRAVGDPLLLLAARIHAALVELHADPAAGRAEALRVQQLAEQPVATPPSPAQARRSVTQPLAMRAAGNTPPSAIITARTQSDEVRLALQLLAAAGRT